MSWATRKGASHPIEKTVEYITRDDGVKYVKYKHGRNYGKTIPTNNQRVRLGRLAVV